MENLYEGIVLEDWEIDPFSMEEKIIFSREETIGLESAEIRAITEDAMSRLPVEDDNVEMAFDIIYDAIIEAIVRVNNRI